MNGPFTTDLRFLAVGQELVFLGWMEEESFHGEGDGLPLERRALIRANEEHLVMFINAGAHQDHL